MTRAPVASMSSLRLRTRHTTRTSKPSSLAALAIGRKCETKNQSSVMTKTSLRPVKSCGEELAVMPAVLEHDPEKVQAFRTGSLPDNKILQPGRVSTRDAGAAKTARPPGRPQ